MHAFSSTRPIKQAQQKLPRGFLGCEAWLAANEEWNLEGREDCGTDAVEIALLFQQEAPSSWDRYGEGGGEWCDGHRAHSNRVKGRHQDESMRPIDALNDLYRNRSCL